MAWVYLFAAGLLETGWAIGLKYTHGFTRPIPSLLTAAAMIVSFVLLAQALKTIPIGTGYAVWTGIGAVGAAILGIWLFGDPATPARLFFLALIVVGILGLKFTGGPAQEKDSSDLKSLAPTSSTAAAAEPERSVAE